LYVHFECGGFVVRSEFGRVLFSPGRGSGGGGRGLLGTILRGGGGGAHRKPGKTSQKTQEQSAHEEEACGHSAGSDELPRFRRTPHENSNAGGRQGIP